MKRVSVLLLTILLAMSTLAFVCFVNLAKADPAPLSYLPVITLNEDGTITPSMNKICKNGTAYFVTADISGYAVEIRKSGVTFDGQGHTINSTGGDNPAIGIHNADNVVIKDMIICSNYNSIYLYYSSNCQIVNVQGNYRIYLTDGSNSNIIEKSSIRVLDIGLGNSNDNSILKCNVTDELDVVGSRNRFWLNNFYFEKAQFITGDNLWDNGSIGNYWNNYLTKYPNASRIDNSAVGDTPYIIERDNYSIRESPNVINVDNYPLMSPYNIAEDKIIFSTVTPSALPTATSFTQASEWLLIFVPTAIIIVVLFLLYRKRHNPSNANCS